MIDIETTVKEQADKMTGATEQQKQDFTEMATALGNFLNCIWKQQERTDYGKIKQDS